ncbi:MAG TPA: ImmA/IrrE family metallo-endopeptidase [Candidatus Polarisedimenticolia bacterium]|nr:ImmA/IrrE family metallo-endopeptidase [Candidatus Polarisedimenticolia bacterium]
MSKPNNQPLAEDILRLADSFVDDPIANVDELRRQLREGGVDPDALRARFHHSATQIVKREQAASRPVPIALQQAIEATRPSDGPEDQFEDQSESQSVTAIRIADHWLDRLLSPLRFPSNLDTARAYRKSSQLAKSDQQELDQLESELKERVKKTDPDLDLVALVSESFLCRFGLDSRDRLTEIAEEFGLDVLYRPAESYDGALLRIGDAQRGCIVINSRIREESRKRFTLAHEIGHFVLPGQQEVSAPCKQQRIENWDADLYRPELEANRFAAEILMPRALMAEFVQSEPSLESIRSIAQLCGTSLTASAVRLITLTPHRAAVVWSQNQKILWSKRSEGFVRWIRKGEVRENSFAAQCYRKQCVPDQLAPVPASAWLYEKGLREGAQIWEQSVGLKNYGAVLSLLVIVEAVEKGK